MPACVSAEPVLPMLNAKAAGIDVGSQSLHVSIAGGKPQVFGTVTRQVQELRAWLVENQVNSVALEATGIYWLCLYEELESAGIEVLVVNGRHVKNLPGRKTDVSDCQWLATLHAHGLLRSGFVPDAAVRRLQDYMRLRQDHITLAASHVQHMQKAFERMNLKPHNVIRNITGVSGLKIVRAILAGERDPRRLLALCDVQIKKNKSAELQEALVGTWKEEHLFALRQALSAWEFYQNQIGECDRAIETVVREMNASATVKPKSAGAENLENRPENLSAEASATSTQTLARGKKKKAKTGGVNTPKIEGLHEMLVNLCGGHDATDLPGIADYTLLQLISETGTDLSRFPTAKHFTSWTGTSPGSHQSGKRRGRAKMRRNRAGRLFCVIARSLARSVDKGLGGFYRRLRARRGGLVANKALARKLAALYWQVMVHGLDFVEYGLKEYEAKTVATEQRALFHLAAKHGFILKPSDTPKMQVVG